MTATARTFPPLPLKTYQDRRTQAARRLAETFGRAVPLLVLGLPAAEARHQPNEPVGRQRQDPWFDWFTGCPESDSALLIDPTSRQRDRLFLEPGDPKRVIWDGARLGPGAQARQQFGVPATSPAAELQVRVLEAAGRAGGQLAMLMRTIEPDLQDRQARAWKRRAGRLGLKILDAHPALVPLRMVKTPEEIALHRQAVAITAAGYRRLLPRIPGFRREAQIAAELAKAYLEVAHEPPAFSTIAGAGVHAATLHYPHNDGPLPRGSLVLIDSGATWRGYCADVTRTVPVSGRFPRGRVRELYELVLQAQELGRYHARPGITLKAWNEMAWKPIQDAGFTRQHGLGHHLGLNVHDPSDRELPLAPGMLLTNEPGIYLPEEGLGIRIEDDLLITAQGCEVTTRAIPKTIEAIEAAMAGSGSPLV